MAVAQLTGYHPKLTKYFLSVALFIGIITTTSYAGKSGSGSQSTIQTEQLISQRQQANKRTISYKKAFDHIQNQILSKEHAFDWSPSLFHFSLVTKEKFSVYSRQFFEYTLFSFNLHTKVIPYGSDEDIFVN